MLSTWLIQKNCAEKHNFNKSVGTHAPLDVTQKKRIFAHAAPPYTHSDSTNSMLHGLSYSLLMACFSSFLLAQADAFSSLHPGQRSVYGAGRHYVQSAKQAPRPEKATKESFIQYGAEPSSWPCSPLVDRHRLLNNALLIAGGSSLGLSSQMTSALPAWASTDVNIRHTVNYTAFQKKFFQKPPGFLAYPSWMEGEWHVSCRFIGADFPSSAANSNPFVPRERIAADTSLPGFRRLSIAMVPDVGKDHDFRMRFLRPNVEGIGTGEVREDKVFNLKQALESELGKATVTNIDYNPAKNPNRASLALLPGSSPNAQRIELFWNARSSLPSPPLETDTTTGPSGSSSGSSSSSQDVFRFVEDIRQVSLTPQLAETSSVGDYRHLWEFYHIGPESIKTYLSTVAYTTPQGPLFQTAGLQPLVVYFHTLTMRRLAGTA